MGAARRAGGDSFTQFAGAMRGSGKGLAIALLLAVFLLGGGIAAWKKWGQVVTQNERYRLSAENIDITPPPAWILSDVKADVIRDGRLRELNLLDPQLTEKVASAFALHSWVANVERVAKQAGPRVVVQLRYRQPVAFVKVPRGLYPIDAEGVFLPPSNFAPVQVNDYLRVLVPDVEAPGPPGTQWGNQQVVDAARIAAAWGDRWRDVGLYGIEADRGSSASAATTVYTLFTRDGVRVIWGAAPGSEGSAEPTAEQKIERLIQIVKEQGALESGTTPPGIDLRNAKQPVQMSSRPSLGAELRSNK